MNQIMRSGVWNNTLIIGDPHLGKRIYQKDESLVFERLEKSLETNENYQDIIILGDLFDIPNPDYDVVFRFLNIVKNIPKNKKIFILEGNHDQKKDLGKKRIFHILEEINLGNVIFVNSPCRYYCGEEEYLLIPYSDSIEAKEKIRKFIDDQRISDYILFAHLELDEVREDYVVKAKHVFSGHDHTPRMQENICWTGSLTPLDKSQDTEKTFFKTASLEEVLSGDYSQNFVEVFVKSNEKVPEEIYQKVRGCRIIVVEDEKEILPQETEMYLNPLQLFHIHLRENNLEDTYKEIISFR